MGLLTRCFCFIGFEHVFSCLSNLFFTSVRFASISVCWVPNPHYRFLWMSPLVSLNYFEVLSYIISIQYIGINSNRWLRIRKCL